MNVSFDKNLSIFSPYFFTASQGGPDTMAPEIRQ